MNEMKCRYIFHISPYEIRWWSYHSYIQTLEIYWRWNPVPSDCMAHTFSKVPVNANKYWNITSGDTIAIMQWPVSIWFPVRATLCHDFRFCSHPSALQWCYNERDGVSNHRRLACLLKRLFRRRWKKTSKLHVTGLCEGIAQVTGEFPTQRASNAEKVSFCDVIMKFHDLREHVQAHRAFVYAALPRNSNLVTTVWLTFCSHVIVCGYSVWYYYWDMRFEATDILTPILYM